MLKHGLRYWSAVSSVADPILVLVGPGTIVDTPTSHVIGWVGEVWQASGRYCTSSGSGLPPSRHTLGLPAQTGQYTLTESVWCWHAWRAVAPHSSSVPILSGAQKADPWLARRVKAPGGLTAGQTPVFVTPDLWKASLLFTRCLKCDFTT